jgi:hypothetical protein
MPVKARRLVRKMRGGAQAHLLEADDGDFYVVKFRNNPQHRRVLVNEWIGGVFLKHLGFTCPHIDLVSLDADFLAGNPDVSIQLGSQRIAIEPGWHFGSRFPGDPGRVAVYDFVPDALLDKVENTAEFPGMLVFDKWTGNADARQCVFLRARLRDYIPAATAHPLRIGFLAMMVDHGYLFNGPHWEYTDAPNLGLYGRPPVYRHVRGWDDFEPWLARMTDFPDQVVDDALRRLPPEWLNGDAGILEQMLEKLMARRRRIPDLIRACAASKWSPFPNWSPASVR